jgi:nucleotide-binding universal stress UspA family protein
MTIKSILVPMTGDSLDRRCLDAAWIAAQPGQAHVTALFGELSAAEMPVIYGGDGVGFYLTEEFLQALTERNDAQRAAAKAVFDAWTVERGVAAAGSAAGTVTASFQTASAGDPDAVKRFAVVNDLVVAALPGEANPARSDILEAALFLAGKPVLLVPDQPVMPPAGKAAVICWNGSAEAAAAVTAALPLLAGAATVTVLMAKAGDPASFLEFLGRHGIAATAVQLSPAMGETGEALLAEAEKLDAGIIVLGAYGHSRAREFIFGGVTRYVLHSARTMLFVAH